MKKTWLQKKERYQRRPGGRRDRVEWGKSNALLLEQSKQHHLASFFQNVR